VNPSVDDRLASIIRSLTDIILTALPHDAELAQEQTHLAIGHLQIIRAQLDALPAFEADELADARLLGVALLAGGEGGESTAQALDAVRAALEHPVGGEHPRESRVRINGAIDELIRQMALDGTPRYRDHAAEVLIRMQSARTLKDRKWFALMGFDSDVSKGG
jgi:hypothetical protein